jgi:hypothetical protein
MSDCADLGILRRRLQGSYVELVNMGSEFSALFL